MARREGTDDVERSEASESGQAPQSETIAPSGENGEALLARLTTILEEAGFYLVAELRDGVVTLSGEIDSEENRQAALDIATALAEPRGLRIDDDIDVMSVAPDQVGRAAEQVDDAFAYVDPDADPLAQFAPGVEMEPDFTGDVGTTDPQEAAAEAEPYFFPTDPVVRPASGDEQLEVLGGFGATSMDNLAGAAGFDERNDDDISQAVLRELGEDALTSDLVIQVDTRNGVVRLRGEVPSLEDAENAEEVAGRVGGVQEVREELAVTGLRSRES